MKLHVTARIPSYGRRIVGNVDLDTFGVWVPTDIMHHFSGFQPEPAHKWLRVPHDIEPV
jgi:hypothetical protein